MSEPRYQAICDACDIASSETGVSELVARDWKANHEHQHDALDDEADPEVRIVRVDDE